MFEEEEEEEEEEEILDDRDLADFEDNLVTSCA